MTWAMYVDLGCVYEDANADADADKKKIRSKTDSSAVHQGEAGYFS